MTSQNTNKIITNKADTNDPLFRTKPQNQRKENKNALKIVWTVKGACERIFEKKSLPFF